MARPFGWAAAMGVIYASLYPFEGWRDSGWQLSIWFLSPWPKYWTQRDLWLNWAGYLPLGFLWAWSLLRGDRSLWRAALAAGQASLFSLLLETLQGFLDARVSSNVDWAFNTLGGISGAILAWWLSAPHRLKQWQAVRTRWVRPHGGTAWALLGLWVVALCVPSALPFAVGRWPGDGWVQVFAWVPTGLMSEAGTRWILDPHQESALIALTLLSPMALVHLAVRGRANKWALGLGVLAAGVLALTIVSGMAHGAHHAGTWLKGSTPLAVGLAAALGAVLLMLPHRWGVRAGLVVVLAHAVGVNTFAHSGYWDMEWQAFLQGPTARVNGVLAWVALLWPWLALLLVAVRAWKEPRA
ncbi:MAG: hypothetical protein RL357_585 [Pseudomonadota bacterium]